MTNEIEELQDLLLQRDREIERLETENGAIIETLKQPDQVGYWQRKYELAQVEIERLSKEGVGVAQKFQEAMDEVERLCGTPVHTDCREVDNSNLELMREIERLREALATARELKEIYHNDLIELRKAHK